MNQQDITNQNEIITRGVELRNKLIAINEEVEEIDYEDDINYSDEEIEELETRANRLKEMIATKPAADKAAIKRRRVIENIRVSILKKYTREREIINLKIATDKSFDSYEALKKLCIKYNNMMNKIRVNKVTIN